jgi:hypothetical protein
MAQPLTTTTKAWQTVFNVTSVDHMLIALKRNDKFMNVHNRSMLEHWCANVDIQIILEHHAAMDYMVKYAIKKECTGNTLQQVIKTIINKADVTNNTCSQTANVDLPYFVIVRWPGYTNPQFFSITMNNGISTHNCIPIPAISIWSDDTTAVRIQFPFRLAYAITVWKS